MEFYDSIEFLQVKSGQTSFVVALELQIEPKKFPRFSKTFTTAKYLSVMQWEEITRSIERIAKNYMKSSPAVEGEFSTEEVNVSWSILPKEESCVRFEKLRFTYTLDWIMVLKITRLSPLPDRPITPDVIDMLPTKKTEVVEYEPNTIDDQFVVLRSRYKPSVIEKSENSKPPEYSPRPLTSPSYGESNNKYTPSKIDNDVVPSSISPNKSTTMMELFGSGSEDERKKEVITASNDEHLNGAEKKTVKKRQLFLHSEPNKPEPQQQKKQSHKKVKIDDKQPTINCWLPSKNQTAKEPTPTKNSQKKPSKNKSATKTNPLESIDDEKMTKMQNFLEKSKQDEMDKDRRRDELESYETWDCNDIERDELERMIVEFAPQIKLLYSNTNSTPARNKKYNAVLLTTSNVLTESQISFVCKQIENQREPHERGYNEEILTEKILPEFIIYVFCKKFGLNKHAALERLKIQEERRTLFSHEDSIFL